MKKHTILVVDDNRISKRITTAFLSRLGVAVVSANDGLEAIQQVAKGKVTAVFMNVMLPKMSGIEATKEIRKTNRQTPIYAITSDPIDEMTDEMKNAGFTNFFTKPFDKEKVIEILTTKQVGPPIFDEQLFSQTFKDPELQKDIIDTFLEEEKVDTKRLLEAFDTKNKDKIYAAIHYMKGSFTYLKATKILELTQPILDKLKEEDVEFALEHQDEFMAYYYELVNVLKKV